MRVSIPSNMEYYEYKPIIAEEHAFRLILLHPASQPKIEIDIIHASLDEENLIEYEAISYVWGTQEMDTSVFVPEVQKHLRVTNSLELVLRDLRRPDTKRCLWVDGICINQNDQNDIEKREKNHQVRLMGRIYNSAHRVLSHLGRSTELTPILRDAITEMQQDQGSQNMAGAQTLQDLEQELEHKLKELEKLQNLPGITDLQQQQKTQELEEILHQMLERQSCEPMEAQKSRNGEIHKTAQVDWEQVSSILAVRHNDFHAKIRQSVELMLKRPWFRRVWIIQEVANAREAVIYWGPTEIPVRYFTDLARILRVEMSAHQKAILDMMPPSRRKGLGLSSRQDLFDLLMRFIGSEATKSHDKIYALLGMCTAGTGHGTVTIDYSKSTESLVREAVAYMSFCDKSDIPDVLNTMERLAEGLGSLFQGLLVHFTTESKLFSLRSLLLNRGDHITITPQIIEKTVQDHKGKEVLSILLSHPTDTVSVSLNAVEEAIVQWNHEATELLLFQLEKQSPCMGKWIRATISMIDLGSQDDLPQYTPLGLAVLIGEADDVRQLLEEGADVDTVVLWPETLPARNRDDLSADSRISWFAWAKRQQGPSLPPLLGIFSDEPDTKDIHCRHWTALALAVHHGREDVVQILLDRGAKIETKCENGRTPLSIAAGGGFDGIVSLGRSTHGAQIVQQTTEGRYLEAGSPTPETDKVYSALVQLLLDRGAEVDSADKFNRSPLWWAVNHGHQLAVEKLLANKAVIEKANSREMSLLSWAIWNGYEDITTQLLENDYQRISIRQDYLAWTIRAGNIPLLQELIDRYALMYGGPFHAFGFPFTVAVEEGNTAALQILTQHRKILRHSSTMSAALFIAASKGDVRCLEILLEAGSNADYADFDGNTPLSRAIAHGNREMVQRLLEKGCSPNGSDRQRYTPLVLAIREGYFDIAQALLESHANLNAKCKSKKPALWAAAILGYQDMVRLLLQHGAVVDVCADRGTTPLMCACAKGHAAVVKVLLDANADLSIRDEDGRTALDWAKRGDRDQIAQILLAHEKFLLEDPEL